jgi:hypothetical protein
MPSIPNRRSRVPLLIANFPRFLRVFEQCPPFTRAGQLEFHVETIAARRALGSVTNALADNAFLCSLYRTLQAWGIGVRASSLVSESDFIGALRARASELAAFDGMCIDDPGLRVNAVSDRLWRTIETLGIVLNESKIVPGTKTLHHILPDLVVPVDRAYTQKFFRWHNPEFQYGQASAFGHSFSAFVEIARSANPKQYVTVGWNSSRTKVIDNAIVGMLCEEQRRTS